LTLTAVLLLEPQNIDALHRRGCIHLDDENYPKAIEDFTAILRLQPDHAKARFNRAYANFAEGILCQTHATDCPTAGLVPMNEEDDGSEQFKAAIEDYSMVLGSQPDDAEALLERGRAHAALGSHDLAVVDFAEAIRIKPDGAEGYYRRGVSHSALGKEDLAAADFASTLRISPDYADSLVADAYHYFNRDMHTPAFWNFDAAVRLAPDDPYVLWSRGWALMDTGEHDSALIDLEKALAIDPDHADALQSRAFIRATRGDHVAAIADLDAALRRKPGDAEVLHARACAYANNGDLDLSIADFDTVIAAKPDSADAYYGRSSVYRRKGEHDRATADLAAAARCEPDNHFGRIALLHARLDNGEPPEVLLPDCEPILKERPCDPDVREICGLANLRAGKAHAAREDFDMGLVLEPERPSLLYGRGIACLRLGLAREGCADLAAATASDADAGRLFNQWGIEPPPGA
jgi:tetratricopeptide (TPR) repeat protein